MPRPLSVSSVEPLRLTLLPLHLVSESNVHDHWRKRAKRRKDHRATTYWWLKHWFPVPPPLPLTITIIRIAPRLLDSWDNLPASAKACVDGCADWLDDAPGKGQDRREGLRWIYGQRKGKVREYAVEIRIDPGEENP